MALSNKYVYQLMSDVIVIKIARMEKMSLVAVSLHATSQNLCHMTNCSKLNHMNFIINFNFIWRHQRISLLTSKRQSKNGILRYILRIYEK